MVTLTVAIVAAGAMGAGIGRKLREAGCVVLTNLDGRSESTKRRAEEAGMVDASLAEISFRARWLLSIMPPAAARPFAEKFIEALSDVQGNAGVPKTGELVFVDCNPLQLESVKEMGSLFAQRTRPIPFIDACIFGGPPRGDHAPSIYACTAPQDVGTLDEFVALSSLGLNISPLKGKGEGIGGASALKMSVSGITTASTALFGSLILATHRTSSPSTSGALIRELNTSQPELLRRIVTVIPPLLPKAYRYVFEMEEISAFVGSEEGVIYRGLAKLCRRVEGAYNEGTIDVAVLRDFVEKAKRSMEGHS